MAGIQVYVHWLWLFWGYFQVVARQGIYRSIGWAVAEYLILFLIVLLHEFGHAFACRQTGGQANQIVLWPLGGIAFVKPPLRATAELWSIAAGPLVNVALLPLLWALQIAAHDAGWLSANPDLARLLIRVQWLNGVMIAFNLLPIYPLDGGQLLRSLLWLRLGRGRSLQVATLIGLPTLAAVAWWAYSSRTLDVGWILVMGLFLAHECWQGFRQSRALLALERMPAHAVFVCPHCRHRPPGGPLWRCDHCGNRFDPFSTRAVCPHCAQHLPAIRCAHCGEASPFERW